MYTMVFPAQCIQIVTNWIDYWYGFSTRASICRCLKYCILRHCENYLSFKYDNLWIMLGCSLKLCFFKEDFQQGYGHSFSFNGFLIWSIVYNYYKMFYYKSGIFFTVLMDFLFPLLMSLEDRCPFLHVGVLEKMNFHSLFKVLTDFDMQIPLFKHV